MFLRAWCPPQLKSVFVDPQNNHSSQQLPRLAPRRARMPPQPSLTVAVTRSISGAGATLVLELEVCQWRRDGPPAKTVVLRRYRELLELESALEDLLREQRISTPILPSTAQTGGLHTSEARCAAVAVFLRVVARLEPPPLPLRRFLQLSSPDAAAASAASAGASRLRRQLGRMPVPDEHAPTASAQRRPLASQPPPRYSGHGRLGAAAQRRRTGEPAAPPAAPPVQPADDADVPAEGAAGPIGGGAHPAGCTLASPTLPIGKCDALASHRFGRMALSANTPAGGQPLSCGAAVRTPDELRCMLEECAEHGLTSPPLVEKMLQYDDGRFDLAAGEVRVCCCEMDSGLGHVQVRGRWPVLGRALCRHVRPAARGCKTRCANQARSEARGG